MSGFTLFANLALPELQAIFADMSLLMQGGIIEPDKFLNYKSVMGDIAVDAEVNYKGYLKGEAIPGRGTLKTPHNLTANGVYLKDDGFCRWNLGNVAPQAEDLENGAPRRDMKKNIANMPKARRSKVDGHAYLIIPFRHNVHSRMNPDSMPQKITDMAEKLKPTIQLGVVGLRPNARGGQVDKYGYLWAGRLTAKNLQASGATPHQIKRYQGMVRMSGRTQEAGVQTSYMTFRVMSERSRPESWWYPAIQALHPLEEAINQAFLCGKPDLENALREDLNRL